MREFQETRYLVYSLKCKGGRGAARGPWVGRTIQFPRLFASWEGPSKAWSLREGHLVPRSKSSTGRRRLGKPAHERERPSAVKQTGLHYKPWAKSHSLSEPQLSELCVEWRLPWIPICKKVSLCSTLSRSQY